MKNTFVVTQLEKYDTNKGYKRTLLRDEPHIKILRGFVAEIKGEERDLTAAELLSLAGILLGKHNRTEEQLSSQIFKSIADVFGGFEVLDYLEESKALNGQNLLFLEKSPVQAGQLAKLMVSLNQKKSIPMLLTASFNMTGEDRLSLFQFLDSSAKKDNLSFYYMFLQNVSKHINQIDGFLALLKAAKEIISVYSVIKTLIDSNQELLTAGNVTRILKLQKPCQFDGHLQILPATQAQLDSLFEIEEQLSFWSIDTLKIFKSAKWDMAPWLQQILTAGEHSFTLLHAIEQLEKSNIFTNKLSLILPCLFAHPKQASNFVDALKIVSNPELLEEDLKLLRRATLYPVPVANAIVALKAATLFSGLNIDVIIANPEHALGLANMVIVFEKLKKFPYLVGRRIIQEHPEYAATTARVLECLLENQLDMANNIRAVCIDRQSHGLLLNLMNILKRAKLLDQKNFVTLISQDKYFKTLKSAIQCLANAEKLDQSNFDLVINDPLNALSVAEKQGGTLYPGTFKFLTDKGAVSFVTVREKTRVMAQGQRQGFFFAEHTEAKNETFVKATGKTIVHAQHEALIKIAGYCGSNELEDDTTQHIASTSYYSSSPGR